MDITKFKDAYVELERIHNRIIQTELELNNIDTALTHTKAILYDAVEYNLSKTNPINTEDSIE